MFCVKRSKNMHYLIYWLQCWCYCKDLCTHTCVCINIHTHVCMHTSIGKPITSITKIISVIGLTDFIVLRCLSNHIVIGQVTPDRALYYRHRCCIKQIHLFVIKTCLRRGMSPHYLYNGSCWCRESINSKAFKYLQSAIKYITQNYYLQVINHCFKVL